MKFLFAALQHESPVNRVFRGFGLAYLAYFG